jgi:type II secretory pathway component GspD/PulD (secretin)
MAVVGHMRRRASWVAVSALIAWFVAGPARADGPPAPAAPSPPEPPTEAKPKPPCRVEKHDERSLRAPDGAEIYLYTTNFVSAGDLVQAVTNVLAIPGVTMKEMPRKPDNPGQPPPRQNQVALQGSKEAIEAALDAFAYFDVPDPQVFVEAKIVEVTYESNFEFGFSSLLDRDKEGPNTIWRGGSVTLNPPSFFQSQQPGNLPFQGVGTSFGFVGELAEKFGAFDLTLQALQRDGTAEVLSRPSIVATQGKLATVKTSQKIPIIQIQTAQGAPSGETLTLGTAFVETKIGLDVMAHHVGEGFVTMKVDPTVSGVTGFSQGVGGTSAPIISERSASTTVTLADGDTLVIGGLYTNTTISDKARVPFLSDIPGLGCLFSRTKDEKVKTELIFFITPHVLRRKSDNRVIVPPGEQERLRGVCDDPCAAVGGEPSR